MVKKKSVKKKVKKSGKKKIVKKVSKKKIVEKVKQKNTRIKRVKKILAKPVESLHKALVNKKILGPSKDVGGVVEKKDLKQSSEVVEKDKGSKVSFLKQTILKKHSKNLKRAGTGISQFDKMVKGGFERESINLIAGGSGSGKTILAFQFLMEGIKKGEKGLYVTFEEKKEEFYENMKKFGWDLEKEEKSGKFIFLEYSPEKVKMMLDEGGGAIETLVLKHGIQRMVIDSITSFSLLFEDKLSKRQATLGLFDIIRKWNVTTLFTVQHDPTSKKDKEISSIEFEADSITLLYFVNIKNKRERFIEILKMRGIDHSTEIHSFEIKKGIKIGNRARIKSKFLK